MSDTSSVATPPPEETAAPDLLDLLHPHHGPFVAALTDALPTFIERGKGQVARQLFMAAAQVFPEDRAVIYAHLQTVQEQYAPKAKGGRARADGPPPVDATPKIRPRVDPNRAAAAAAGPDCPDCPPVGMPTGTANGVTAPAPEALRTKQGVLDAYESDVPTLLHVAKSLSINTGGSTKPETLAGKIAHHYRTEAERLEANTPAQ